MYALFGLLLSLPIKADPVEGPEVVIDSLVYKLYTKVELSVVKREAVLVRCFKKGDIVVPDTIEVTTEMLPAEGRLYGDPMEIIPYEGFYPVESANSAFNYNDDITSVVLPKRMKTVPGFYRCHNLRSVILPDSIKSIGSYTFGETWQLQSLIIPEGVVTIETSAFWRSGIWNVTFPNTLEHIDLAAFSECMNLQSVVIPASVKTIGAGAFMGCGGMKSAKILCPIEKVPGNLFERAVSLESVELPNTVLIIGENAFWRNHSLKKFTFPENVQIIERSAFEETVIKELDLPASVDSIGERAFAALKANNGGIRLIKVNAAVPPKAEFDNTFTNYDNTEWRIYQEVPLEVPTESIELYRNAPVWKNFITILPLGTTPLEHDDDPEIVAPEDWTNQITNGNLAGDNTDNYFSKEAPSTTIVHSRIEALAGYNNSHGIVVKSTDEVGKEGAQDWDTQFWIKLNDALPEGTKLHVEFDYKADKAATASTQAHGAPGFYQHWAAIGDVNFTTEWQHFSADIDVDAAMAKGDNGNGNGIGLQSIAFNLAVERTAVEYYFDNFGIWAQIPASVADGKYYILNKGTEKYLAAGSSWGTHAIVNAAGLDYEVAFTNGKYTLDSQVSDGGTKNFLNGSAADGPWNDGAEFGWIIETTEDGDYTISNGTSYLTAGGDGVVTFTANATAEATHWVMKTKADRIAELASVNAPIDATFLITAANFSRNDLRNATAWTNENGSVALSGGNNINNNAESYMKAFNLSQTLTDIPNGVYKVEAQAAVTFHDNRNIKEYDGNGYPVIFVNDQTSNFNEMIAEDQLTSQSKLSEQFTAGYYEVEPITIVVVDGTLTVGAKSDRDDIWAVFDNFRLTYYGGIVNDDDPEPQAPEGWINLIANGNLAGDDVTNYVAKEYPSADIVGATIVPGKGKNNSRGIVVKSADEVGKEGAQDWDTQFWIKVNEPLPVGSKLHVEFDYAASKTAKAGTQAHGEPGTYQHWGMIGDMNFTTEWQHFSQDVEINDAMAKGNDGNGNGIGLISIAFNLAIERTAVEYYFDNFGVWAQKPAPVETWTDLIVNGNMEGESMECFYVTEQGVGGPFIAVATDGIGKGGSKAVKVQSANDPTNNWDTQFFIRLPYQLPAGIKNKVSFDYKADQVGNFETQSHAEPGQYIHWAAIGSGSFTDEWQTYAAEGSVPAECDGSQGNGFLKIFQTVAFNLALNQTATEFIFDNVKFEVPSDIVETLVLNPYVGKDADELEAPEDWIKVIANGNLAGESVENYFAKEYPSTEIVGATIVPGAGKNNSRGIVVKAGDDTGNEGAVAWDSQFWIKVNEPLADGTKLHVEFDYKASQAAKATTQAHGAPGAYLHWAMIGDVNFTTEWQHFSADVTIEGSMANMESIAFNLQEEKSATDYYFDNFGVWIQRPVPVDTWTDLIFNGDMQGDDNSCFYVTEQGVGGPFLAPFTDGIGVNGGKAVKVQSADSPANDLDTQFFIRLPYQLPAGTKYKVSFDYKADKAGDFDTQAHAEPGAYIHWACIGSGSFTTEWQTYEKEGSISADMSKEGQLMQSIAFNLAKNQTATEFIFDNVKFEVPTDVVSTLNLNPAVDPQPYPTDIKSLMSDKNAEGIYNLNGQKVQKSQKGFYIKNGKKVVIK